MNTLENIFLILLKVVFIIIPITEDVLAQSKSNDSNIVIILNKSSITHNEFYEFFEKSVNRNSSEKLITIEKVDIDNILVEEIDKTSLIISVGTIALEQVLKKELDNMIWSALIPEQSYYSLINAYDAEKTKAWFINQPIRRRIALLNVVLPDVTNYGLLVNQSFDYKLDSLVKVFSKRKLNLKVQKVNNKESPIKVSKELFDEIESLFTVVDPAVLNRNTAKGILLNSYRKKVPVIAYSNSYVQAGALAAVYSKISQLARHLAEDSISYFSSKLVGINTTQYPKYFSVAVNHNIARSLSIRLKSEEEIHKLISQINDD